MFFKEEEELYLMNELKRIENERKERERVISHDVQKFVQQQDPNVLTTNNSIQRTVSSSSRRSSINQDYLQRLNNSSNRISTTQKIVKKIKFCFYFISFFFRQHLNLLLELNFLNLNVPVFFYVVNV